MRTTMRRVSATAALAALGGTGFILATSTSAKAVTLTPSDLVVYRVGTTGSTLSNAAAPIFLDTYGSDTTDGTAAKSTFAVPTTTVGTQHRLTATGLSRSEGQLTLSPDGTLLAFTGYDAALGDTGPAISYQDVNNNTVNVTESLTASDPTSVGRVVGLLDGSGAIDTSTSLTGAGVPHVVRTAVTVNGQSVYVGGSDAGVLTASRGAATATSLLSDSDTGFGANELEVAGGQLFAGGYDADGSKRLVTVDTGTPAGVPTLTGLGGLPPGLLPGGFAFLDLTSAGLGSTGLDTLYAVNSAEKGGAIDKFTYDGASWTKQGAVALDGVESLTIKKTDSQVLVAATTPSGLYTFGEEDGSAAGFTTTDVKKIATPPTGSEFRGVAVAPTGAALSAPAVSITAPKPSQHFSYLQGAVAFHGTASGTRGIASVAVKLDRGAYSAARLSGTTWSKTVNVSSLAVGVHRLYVTATEKANGASTTVARVFVRNGIPTGAIGPGKRSFTDRLVSKQRGYVTVRYAASPDHKGLRTSGKPTVRFTSYGRTLDLHLQRSAAAGKVRITVAGRSSVVNLYSRRTLDLRKRYSGLSAGRHAVVITPLHQKSAHSKGTVVLLGFLQVFA